MYMSWKAIDSRAKTSGSALYADTVFYNETNHDFVSGDGRHTSDKIVARDIRALEKLTVQLGDSTSKHLIVGEAENPFISIKGSHTNNGSVSGGAAMKIDGTFFQYGDIYVNKASDATNKGEIHAVGPISTESTLTVHGNISSSHGSIEGNQLVSRGDVTCFYSSDRRLKEDITQIENAGETVDKLRGVRFKWRDEWFKENEVILAHQDDMGFIAQEVEEVVPEMVSEKGNGYKGISYHKLVPLLLEAVKDLRLDVRRLEGEIKEIRANHD